MSSGQIYRFLAVIILITALAGVCEARDHNLVGWWKLDDGAGSTAIDSSGNGNDAVLNGTFQWVQGQLGGGLHLDGTTAYGEVAADSSMIVLNQEGGFAFMAWLKTDALDGATQYAFQQGDLNGTGRSWLYINASDSICTYVGGGTTDSGFVVESETWYHAGFVVTEEGATDSIQTYVNSEPQGTGSRGMESCEGGFFIGTHKNLATGTRWTGTLDDLRLYNRALDQEDLQAAMMGILPEAARGPVPADGATDVQTDVILIWVPGQYAMTHDVYLGTVFEDVDLASRANPLGVLVSQGQADTAYTVASSLELGQTYYWRVDEVNDAPDYTIYKGSVWSFTIEPVAYKVESVLATSNAMSTEDQGPENAVNGSGLNADDQHSTAVSDMWTCTAPEGEAPYIQFEFDRVLKLHEMLIWNYNMAFEAFLGIGIKDATVEYSEDGMIWTLLGDLELAQGTALNTYTYGTVVSLDGAAAKYARITANSNFGGSTQYGLSEVRFTYIPARASEPEPADGASGIDPDVVLSWRAGRDALSHEVYTGIDPNTLDLVATVDQARYAGTFALGTTYYWRVDEVAADRTWASDLWSFTTQEYIVLDDFESYNDDIEAGQTIWQSWVDGIDDPTNGGAVVGYGQSPFAELTTIHGGNQAMPLFYSNMNGHVHSEATHTFASPLDLTAHGVRSLTFYIYGDVANAAVGRLYAKINETKVYYDSVSDVLQRSQWMLWPIDLTQVNTNLANVTSLSIGIDDAGASGVLYVDDVRLYTEAVEMVQPMSPADNDPNLAAYYTFDGTPNDSTGNYPGTVAGSPEYASGFVGQAISLNGVNDHVVSLFAADEIWPAYTVSVWVKAASLAQPQYCSVFNNNAAASDFQIDIDGTDPGNYHYRGTANKVIGPVSSTDWVHLAVRCDGTVTDLYYNGLQVATLNLADTQFGQIAFGVNRAQDYWYAGLIDEARIYNRALSDGEVAGLTGISEPISVLGF